MGNEKTLISSLAPSAFHSISEMMREVLRLHDIDVGTVKPAIVEKYNRNTGIAQVRLLVQDVFASQDGDVYKDVASLVVPVLRMQHGMFWVDAPLYPGDTGYVVAGHRDGSLAVEGNSKPVLEPKVSAAGEEARTNNMGPQPPNTYLLHRYENGFFVPCRWGEIAVEEEDKDSLVVARLRENAEKARQGIFETDGVEGKVALDKDGTVRVVNGTGVVVKSDEYRLAEEGEEPDLVTEDGRRLKRKPKAIIDPTKDLRKTDARFREVEMPTGGAYVGEDGNVHIPTKKVLVLADEGSEKGDEIIVPGGGGGGGEENVLENVNIHAEVKEEDSVPFSVSKSWDGKTINFGLVIGSDKDEGYCNSISGGDIGNEISGGGVGGGVGGGNSISRTPCGDKEPNE